MDAKTRKMLTVEKLHHPRADKTGCASHGLQEDVAWSSLTELQNHNHPVGWVKHHENRNKMYSIIKNTDRFQNELGCPEMLTNWTRDYVDPSTSNEWNKRLNIVGYNNCREPGREKQWTVTMQIEQTKQQKTRRCLRNTCMKWEVKGLIIATRTNGYHYHIIKDETNPLCRISGKYEETIDHIASGCTELAKIEYICRHNKTCTGGYKTEESEKWII